MMSRALVTMFIAMVGVSTALSADGPSRPVVKPTIGETLAGIAAKRELALKELDRLPELAQTSSLEVMKKLAEFWQGTEVKKEFDAHSVTAEKRLADVGIRPTYDNKDVYWAIQKAVVDPSAIKKICSEFVEDAQAAVEKEQAELLERLGSQSERLADELFRNAQDDIRKQVDKAVADHFPVWKGRKIPFKAPTSPDGKPKERRPPAGIPPIAGLAGVLILIFQKAVKRLVQKLVKRIIGKVLAKLIPIIGWLLIIVEIWGIANARTDLEKELRTIYLEEYQTQFTQETVWKEISPDVRKRIEEDLTRWTQQCKEEARRLLHTAEMLEAPGIKQWLEKKEQDGSNLEVVLQQLISVRDVFGTLALAHKIDTLLEILVFAPDKGELQELVRQLGDRVVKEYEQGGKRFLDAAHHLGIPLFLEVLNEPLLSWEAAYDVLRSLPRESSAEEKSGVIQALRVGIDPQLLSGDDRRELGRMPRDVLARLATACQDRSKLRKIVIDRALREPAEAICKASPELAKEWLSQRELPELLQFAKDGRRKAIIDLFQVRNSQNSCSPKAFVAEVKDAEIVTFQELGRDGIEIRDAYTCGGGGEYQEGQANRALGLFRKGVVKDALLRPEWLRIADWFSILPVFGVSLFNSIYPIFPASRMAVSLLAFLIVLVPPVLCILLAYRGFRLFFSTPSARGDVTVRTTPLGLRPIEPIQVHVKLSADSSAKSPELGNINDPKILEDKTG